MKKTLLVIFTTISLISFGQHESVGALRYNIDINKNQGERQIKKSLVNTFDSTFYYLMDTLSLPLLDEFSTNRFQVYNAEFGDGNVSDTLFYRLEQGGVPVATGAMFSESQTYRYEVDTSNTTIPDGVDTFLLAGVTYRFFDLSSYPVSELDLILFPNYDLYDTINVPNPQDTIYREANIVCQDSARLFFAINQDLNSIWIDDFAFHNYTKAIKPFSLGVASLDGVDENGVPYLDGAATGYGVGDYLTSKEIDLNYNPSDEIYFSFLYQGGGYGNEPDIDDSLVVEFYAPDSNEWYHIWSTPGAEMDTFFRAHIAITEPMFLKTGFQFRLKNYATLVGQLDFWHIDYVQLRSSPGFGAGDTIINDVAWSMPINTLLDEYTGVPWKHYKAEVDKLSKMTDSMPSIIRNSIPADAFDSGGKIELNEAPNTLIRIVPSDFYSDISDGLNYEGEKTYTMFHDIRGEGFSFADDVANDTSKVFKILATMETSSIQIHEGNDSNYFDQTFSHYYSYDDGSAEEAYGVVGSQSELAYKFTGFQPDSLVAISMHFVKSTDNVSDNPFLLTVWDDNGGEPGDILYQDDFFNAKYPEYTSYHGGFYYYTFADSMKLFVPETYYVGWKQIDPDRLDVGLDLNTVNNDKIFFSIDNGGSWNNSSFEGSLMIRPIVDSELNDIVSIDDMTPFELDVQIFPNPASSQFSLAGNLNEIEFVKLIDVTGQEVLQDFNLVNVDISNLTKGIYFVQMIGTSDQILKTEKLVIQ